MTDDVTHLGSLVTHPGWLLFLEHCRKTWGPEGYGRQLKQAVLRTQLDKGDVAAAVTAVDLAATEINSLLSWPVERMKHGAPPSTELSLHRGGR